MNKFDPYEKLGVARDADEKAIRAAGKRKAKKHHPDAGGNRAEFEATRHALAVLLDPARRQRFDQTGTIEDRKLDVGAGAMQLIHEQIGALADGFLKNGFSPQFDPRRLDVPAALKNAITASLNQIKQNQMVGQTHATFLRDLARRFKVRKGKGDNLIARGIEVSAGAVEGKLKDLEGPRACHELALQLLENYDFERDPAQWVNVYTTSTATW